MVLLCFAMALNLILWPGPEVRHQPPGTTIYISYNYVLYQNIAAGIAVKASRHYARGLRFETSRTFLLFAFSFVHTNMNLYIQCMYLVYTSYEQALNKYVHKHVCNARFFYPLSRQESP